MKTSKIVFPLKIGHILEIPKWISKLKQKRIFQKQPVPSYLVQHEHFDFQTKDGTSIVVVFAATSDMCMIKNPITLKANARFKTEQRSNSQILVES